MLFCLLLSKSGHSSGNPAFLGLLLEARCSPTQGIQDLQVTCCAWAFSMHTEHGKGLCILVRLTALISLSLQGFSALQEEVYSSRHKQEHQRISKDGEPTEHPPLVSEEDVSVSYSPFQDSTPRSEAEVSMAELLRQAHKQQVEAEFSGKPQDVPGKPSSSQQEYL